MATVNANNITLGAPDQSVTGSVLTAPKGTAIPTTAIESLDSAFTSSGFVSEDGMELEWDQQKTTIRDWSGKARRTVITSTEGTITFALLEISYEGLVQAFGAGCVTQTPATSTHGRQIRVGVTGELPEACEWCFNMKDGDRRLRVVAPNAQVTSIPNMTFTAGDAVTIPVEITCYPDETTGEIVVIMDDDGETA